MLYCWFTLFNCQGWSDIIYFPVGRQEIHIYELCYHAACISYFERFIQVLKSTWYWWKSLKTLAISSRHNWLKLPTFLLMGQKRLHLGLDICMKRKTLKLNSKARWYELYTLHMETRYHFIEFLWNETNDIQARLLLCGKDIMRFKVLATSHTRSYQMANKSGAQAH